MWEKYKNIRRYLESIEHELNNFFEKNKSNNQNISVGIFSILKKWNNFILLMVKKYSFYY